MSIQSAGIALGQASRSMDRRDERVRKDTLFEQGQEDRTRRHEQEDYASDRQQTNDQYTDARRGTVEEVGQAAGVQREIDSNTQDSTLKDQLTAQSQDAFRKGMAEGGDGLKEATRLWNKMYPDEQYESVEIVPPAESAGASQVGNEVGPTLEATKSDGTKVRMTAKDYAETIGLFAVRDPNKGTMKWVDEKTEEKWGR